MKYKLAAQTKPQGVHTKMLQALVSSVTCNGHFDLFLSDSIAQNNLCHCGSTPACCNFQEDLQSCFRRLSCQPTQCLVHRATAIAKAFDRF